MAKNCKIGDVLYWRSRSWPFNEQPSGPLTVVGVYPAPEKVNGEGYQWLSVKDKDGNILTQGSSGNEAFGSHLFRKAPQKTQTENKAVRDYKAAKTVLGVLKRHKKIDIPKLCRLVRPLVPEVGDADLKAALWYLHGKGMVDITPNWDVSYRPLI